MIRDVILVPTLPPFYIMVQRHLPSKVSIPVCCAFTDLRIFECYVFLDPLFFPLFSPCFYDTLLRAGPLGVESVRCI